MQRVTIVLGVITIVCLLLLVSYENVLVWANGGAPADDDTTTRYIYQNHTIYKNITKEIYINNTVYVNVGGEKVDPPAPYMDEITITPADLDVSDGWQDDDGNLRYVTLMYKPTAVDDDLNCIRRFVGSVHYFEQEKIKTTVFGYEVPENFLNEIRTFSFVRFIEIPSEHGGVSKDAAHAYMMDICRSLYAKFLYVDSCSKQILLAKSLATKISAETNSGKLVVTKGGNPLEEAYGFIRGEGTGASVDFDEYFQLNPEKRDQYGRCSLLRNMTSPFRTRHVFSNHNEGFLKKEARHNADDRLVCISIATYSGSNPNMEVRDFSLMSKVMPTFLSSTKGEDTPTSRYRFAMYLGLQPDKFYDDKAKFEELTSSIISQTADRSFSLRIYHTPLNAPAMDITYKWNVLIDQGYRDGCDYIYQYSDDTEFLTPWADTFIRYLESESNFGIVGATDQNNRGIMTLAFSHRTHVTILKTFWPTHFKNWYSDTWAQFVYGERYTKHFQDVLMLNTQKQGQRYNACEHNALNKQLTKEESRPAFVRWLKQQPQTFDVQQKIKYYESEVPQIKRSLNATSL